MLDLNKWFRNNLGVPPSRNCFLNYLHSFLLPIFISKKFYTYLLFQGRLVKLSSSSLRNIDVN